MFTLFANNKEKEEACVNRGLLNEFCASIWSQDSFLIDYLVNYYLSLDCSHSKSFFIEKLQEMHLKILSNPLLKETNDLHKFGYFFLICFEYKINPQDPLDNFLWFDKQNQLYPSLLLLFLRSVKEPEFHTANPIFADLGYQNLSLFMLLMRNFSFWGNFIPEIEYQFLQNLLEHSEVNLNEQNNSWGNTYLHFMISNSCSRECIRFLKTILAIDKTNLCHLNINALSKAYGTAPLHLAVAKGYRDKDSEGRQVASFLSLLETLIQAGADVNLKTATHLCHQINGSLKLSLLNSSAEQTALHIACARRDLEMMTVLMECGADTTIKNAQDLTALDVFQLPYLRRKEIVDSISGEGLNNFASYEKEHSTPDHIALCEELFRNSAEKSWAI
ncbi:ankyrin repeat protein [Legionella massiliensis]|uniref:Ankyrin repeat protein n=1 Tax=Legionella massiliensis TaxID=1034943 RepID=A0A078L5U6_9GAMM|nr:hypothetical protein [Legionella massiliensis]CDZ79318.1 ankyrin repeat protein [Legionella massiliensis]CEE15056.1 Ankyrin repeat protein [Legionella massiliensis]